MCKQHHLRRGADLFMSFIGRKARDCPALAAVAGSPPGSVASGGFEAIRSRRCAFGRPGLTDRVRRLTTALAASVLCASMSPARAGDLEDGMRFYENGQYVAAEDKLRRAARDGDARAAEMLGFMYAFGNSLYPGVAQDGRAAIGYLDMAARGGRPAARYMVCAMRQQPSGGATQKRHCFDRVAEVGRPAPR